MTQEEFFEQENARNIKRDILYKKHLSEIIKLQEKQVKAQESMINVLKDALITQQSQSLKPPIHNDGASKDTTQ